MKRPTVFVVDDEEQIATLLTRILQREGYAVRAFSSGEDALAAIPAERPDLVVTDLMMPTMSGVELVRRVRDAAPETRAVLTTGYASIDNVVDALRSGVDDFVTKPFSVAEIRDVVARVLKRGRPEAAAPAADATESPPPLARRIRDVTLVESVHSLVSDELSSAELLPRCAAVLAGALGVQRGALLAPTGREAWFRVKSATAPDGPWTARLDVESAPLALLTVSGIAGSPPPEALGAAAALLDAGPLAAAALCPRDPHGEDSGVLVVSRGPAMPAFSPEDLRVLEVLAQALGDVFRVVRTAERAEDAYVESLCDVVAATESRSPWFAHHSERVRELSLALGRRVGLAPQDLAVLDVASRLLDLGRIETPDGLLEKAGRPSPEEWQRLRLHATRADDLVRPLGRLRHAKPVIRHHHENWDGSGYPDGLAGEAIPHLAALVRITDSFAALTSERAWRPALDVPSAVRQIVELSGRHFHPQLVAAFVGLDLAPGAPKEPTS